MSLIIRHVSRVILILQMRKSVLLSVCVSFTSILFSFILQDSKQEGGSRDNHRL